jgi:hypothetical protein
MANINLYNLRKMFTYFLPQKRKRKRKNINMKKKETKTDYEPEEETKSRRNQEARRTPEENQAKERQKNVESAKKNFEGELKVQMACPICTPLV